MLSRIAHRHAYLGITEPQYHVVYEHVSAAIAEDLAEVITPEIAEAWTEVYWLMPTPLSSLNRASTPRRTTTGCGCHGGSRARRRPAQAPSPSRPSRPTIPPAPRPVHHPFMKNIRNEAINAGIPATRIHYKVFGPDIWFAS
ncbi:hypothetical protein [Pseudarthrobacter sp. NamB4]|uniref:hypothetical protein n=1 Tax=Pseudarthrobacter sp. NamB4 TaxID=2576837 RepID=UPI002683EFD4